MNTLDIIILVVWGLAAFWGFRSGLVRMVVPLIVVIIGLAFASRIAGPVGNLFSFITDNENVQTVIAFVVIFIGLLIISGWVAWALRTALKITVIFGLVDNLLGMLVGILVGFVLLAGVLVGIQKFPFGNLPETIDESKLGSFLADNFDVVIRGLKLIPSDWNQRFQEIRDDVGDRIPDSIPGR